MPQPPAWSLRLVDVLGTHVDEATEEHLERLIAGAVREDDDLDFKRDGYGNSDSARRELAADIAALANHRGGLLIIGVRDESDVAAELTPVKLVDGEEARIRQIAAGNIAPHLAFDVRTVPSERTPGRGYHLLIVPPSTLRPHAVRKDHDLRYPRRYGTTTRWLAEAEVADAYRDRFRVAGDQAARVARIVDEGLAAMDLSEEAFVAVGVVPTGAGSMPIDLARVAAVGEWARDRVGPATFFAGFFERDAPPAIPGVAAHRVTLTTIHQTDRPPSWQYAELYDDGAGFACLRLMDPRRAWQGQERAGNWVVNEWLLFELARCLLLLGRHAGENCGAWGDALAEARVVARGATRLAYLGPHGIAEPVSGGREQSDAVTSRHTVVLDGLARAGAPLLATTRVLATELFHALGSPEVRQLTADGRVRGRYLHEDRRQLQDWAAAHGIEITDESVPGE